VWAGEMTPLVAVPDPWGRYAKRTIDRIQDEGLLERVRERLTHDIARIQIEHRH